MTTDFEKPEQVEETFLAGLEASPTPTDNLLGILERLIELEHLDIATDWGDMLHAALVESQDADSGIRLLEIRSKAAADDEKISPGVHQ